MCPLDCFDLCSLLCINILFFANGLLEQKNEMFSEKKGLKSLIDKTDKQSLLHLAKKKKKERCYQGHSQTQSSYYIRPLLCGSRVNDFCNLGVW